MLALCRIKHQWSTPRGTPGNFGPKWPTPVDLSVGNIRSQITAEWLQIAQRLQWRAYRKLPLLFWMVPSLTPLRPLLLPKCVFHMPPRYANSHIFAMGDPIRFMFGSRVGFSGSVDRMALFLVTSNWSWKISNGHISTTAIWSTYVARIARLSLR